jgi:hypothetical protein
VRNFALFAKVPFSQGFLETFKVIVGAPQGRVKHVTLRDEYHMHILSIQSHPHVLLKA